MMMSDMERAFFYLIRYPSAHSPASACGAKACSKKRSCQHNQSPIFAALRSHLCTFGVWPQVSRNLA